jgi:hypothetical protein
MFKENNFDNLAKNTNKKPEDSQLNLYGEFDNADEKRAKEEIIAGIQKKVRDGGIRFQENEKNERAKDIINSSKAISGMIKDIREKPQA